MTDREEMLSRLFMKMIEFDRSDPKRIQHFTKVASYARLIGQGEGLDEETAFTLEAAALVHDIGIHVAEDKYGRQNGKLQEAEGPAPARRLLEECGFPGDVTDRVCYLVGHHHTYKDIDGIDYQILVEADFLVNIFEDGDTGADAADPGMKETALKVRENIFRTRTGTFILDNMFLKDRYHA